MMDEDVARALDRQLRIEGWSQDALRRAVVLLVCDPEGCAHSYLGTHVALQLTALGVGAIAWLHSEHAVLHGLRGVLAGLSRRHAVRQIALRASLQSKAEVDLVPPWGFDIVVDVSRRPAFRNRALELAARARVPYLGVLDLPSAGLVWSVRPELGDERRPREMDGIASLGTGWLTGVAAAALATHEVRRLLAPRESDVEADPLVAFSPWQPGRFAPPANRFEPPTHIPRTEGAILIVGCGGIGTWAAYSLLPHLGGGVLYLLDDDLIDETNTNRQVFYAGATGMPKTIVLAAHLRDLGTPARIVPVMGRFEGREMLARFRPKPHVIIGAVDSFGARRLLNETAVAEGIAYVDGATDPDLARIVAVHPRGACLCRMGIAQLAAQENDRARRAPSCGAPGAAPSIVTTNAWAGAAIAAEVLHVLDPATLGEPARQTLEFASANPGRQRLMGPSEPCSCWPAPASAWTKLTEALARFRRPPGVQHPQSPATP